MIKKLPCDAGDTGSIPDLGTMIPYPMEYLDPNIQTTQTSTTKAAATTRESAHHRERSHMTQ